MRRFRIVSYNIHGGRGLVGRPNLAETGRVLRKLDADAVVLQEVDVGRRRSRDLDQATVLGELLGMRAHFFAAMSIEEGSYGNAVLSPHGFEVKCEGPLPGITKAPAGWRRVIEPRAAIWVRFLLPGEHLDLIGTHLSLYPPERLVQARELIGPAWVGHPEFSRLGVLCGDLNTLPDSPTHRAFASVLRDSAVVTGARRPRTFPAALPTVSIDHVFVTEPVEVMRLWAPSSASVRRASDHRPIIVDLELP